MKFKLLNIMYASFFFKINLYGTPPTSSSYNVGDQFSSLAPAPKTVKSQDLGKEKVG